MLCKKLFLTAILGCFAIAAGSLQAMTPQVRLPDWQRSQIAISEWQPEHGILIIRVTVEASAMALSNVSSRLHIPVEPSLPDNTHKKQSMKKGEKAVFMHKINIKPNFAGWCEVDLRAQPDKKELIELIGSVHANEQATRAILEAEAQTISQPIFIGNSMPLLLRDDIAICTAKETAFRPDFKSDNHEFYVWHPESGTGTGLTAELLKAFSAALSAGNVKNALSTAETLIRKLKGSKDPLKLEKANGESFMIPAEVAIALIEADTLTLSAVVNKDTESLQKALMAMKPGYTRPFLMFNLGNLYASLKKNDKAKTYIKQALDAIESWPLAKKQLENLKN